jgi:glutathione S-transferase
MHLYAGMLSLYSRKVEIALHEKALQFTREFVPFTQMRGYQPKHPAVLAANPKGRVPVFTDSDLTLYESTIIIEYLEDAHPAPALYPATPAARAICRHWEAYADEVMIEPLTKLMFRTEPPGPNRAAQEAEAALAVPKLREQHAVLDAALAGRDHLCGAFTVADISAWMAVLWATRLGCPPAEAPALEVWYARLAARPAFATVATEIAAADRALSYPWVS